MIFTHLIDTADNVYTTPHLCDATILAHTRKFLKEHPTAAIALPLDEQTLNAIHQTQDNIDKLIRNNYSDITIDDEPIKIAAHIPAFHHSINPNSMRFGYVNDKAPSEIFNMFAAQEHKITTLFANIARPFFGNDGCVIIHHNGSLPEGHHVDGHNTLIIPTRKGDNHTQFDHDGITHTFPDNHLACLGSSFLHEAPQKPRYIIRAIPAFE